MKISPTRIIIAVRRIGVLSLGWRMMSQQSREMKIQNWSKMAMNREEWKRIVEKAKTHRVVAPREEQGSCQKTIISHTILNIIRHFVKERLMSTSKCFGPSKYINICSQNSIHSQEVSIMRAKKKCFTSRNFSV